MKLGEARQAASERLSMLRQEKWELSRMLEEKTDNSTGRFDRVEITGRLEAVEKEYEQASKTADQLSIMDGVIQNAVAAQQQGEAAAEQSEELMKVLEIFRRISNGDQVPPTDEKKLMEYSFELYASAKNLAMMKQRSKGEKHESLWDEEKDVEEEPMDPSQVADNVEVGSPLPAAESSLGDSVQGENLPSPKG